MLDPLTAFGVAASTVQLVQFSADVISECRTFLKSTTNGLPHNDKVEELVNHSKALAKDISSVSHARISAEEAATIQLAERLLKAADSLIEQLDDLKVHPQADGTVSKRETIRQILRSRHNRPDIEASEERLFRCQNQLATALLHLIRTDQRSIFDRLRACIQDQKDDNAQAVIDAKDSLLDAVKLSSQTTKQGFDHLASNGLQSETRILQQIDDSRQRIDRLTLSLDQQINAQAAATHKFKQNVLNEKENEKVRSIITSLRFPDMKLRRDAIEIAAHETFQWIFDQSSVFQQWLKSNDDLFWISGNAGSGKSTLMKFLTSHPMTPELLKQWAGTNELHVVDSYFWYLGSRMQKSEEGLLRTLLYKILSVCPTLVPLATPSRWNEDDSFHTSPDPWTLKELSQCLERLAQNSQMSFRFCVFVDGLDEYESNHPRLVKQMQILAKSPVFKVCVSSRPWNVFDKAFGYLKNKLQLQDLTRSDMSRYVHGELAEAQIDCSAADLLATEIVSKAQGVFLWVYLVVQSVHDGLAEGDSIGILRRRIAALPSDLEEYFRLILARVDSVYQKHTYKALKLAMLWTTDKLNLQSSRSTFIDYWLLSQEDGEMGAPDFTTLVEPKHCTTREWIVMLKDTKTFLKACTKDLLQIRKHEDKGDRPLLYLRDVEFLHRTVYDFLVAQMQHKLDEQVPASFKKDDVLQYVILARSQVIPCDIEVPCEYYQKMMYWALDQRHYEDSFLDDCERVGLYYQNHFCRPACQCTRPSATFQNYLTWTFAAAGHAPYVTRVLDQAPWFAERTISGECLLSAVLGFSSNSFRPLDQINLELLRAVLEAGADPNQKNPWGRTIWHQFLTLWHDAATSPTSSNSTLGGSHVWEVTRLLMENGADLFDEVEIGWPPERLPLSDVMAKLPLPPNAPAELDDVLIKRFGSIEPDFESDIEAEWDSLQSPGKMLSSPLPSEDNVLRGLGYRPSTPVLDGIVEQ